MIDKGRADELFDVHDRTMERVATCLAKSEQLMRSSQELILRSEELRKYDPLGPTRR
jgi:hypothetical protein